MSLTPADLADVRAWLEDQLRSPIARTTTPLPPRKARALAHQLLETLDEQRDAFANWLLDVGYGGDFTFHDGEGAERRPNLPPPGILEAMVRLGALRPDMVAQTEPNDPGPDIPRPVEDREEEMYYILSSELGDWRLPPDRAEVGSDGYGTVEHWVRTKGAHA